MVRGDRLPTLAARRISAGLSVTDLARRTNTSDRIIRELENGGNCDPHIVQRIVDILGPSVAVTTSSVANPTVVTTASNVFKSGDTVTIAGHTGSTPAVDGDRVATVTAATTFTVPVNVSVGGTGGTAVLSPTTLGVIHL